MFTYDNNGNKQKIKSIENFKKNTDEEDDPTGGGAQDEEYNDGKKSCRCIVKTIIILAFIGILMCFICFIIQSCNKDKKALQSDFGYSFD
jgi:hypothetical protein